ncbi:hypothetical protein [Halorussus aquaticus]|uniref:Lipoprotein n=1 Tax=Halorussus aquaticus TaxID=2953748 RepID=A0ABD5Q2H8_9EURY|nr:hypothetical protein [Halorussus aquaticus]
MRSRRAFLISLLAATVSAGCSSRPRPDPIELTVRNSGTDPYRVRIVLDEVESDRTFSEEITVAAGDVAELSAFPRYRGVHAKVFVNGSIAFERTYTSGPSCSSREFSVDVGTDGYVTLLDGTCV